MADLVPQPVLDLRDEDLIAAQAIFRVSGALTVEICDRYIGIMRAAKQTLLDGAAPTQPVCPELTNINAGSEHTGLIEVFSWLIGFVTYAINQVPLQNVIEFARLFKIELRGATSATTTLRFTVASPDVDVTIPQGTEVRTLSGIIFATDDELVIPAGDVTGDVSATHAIAGRIILAPNTLTEMVDFIIYVTGVTNPAAIESGTERETVESALERMRSYQRRGERLVSASDLEDTILNEVLLGNGVVKAFPFIRNGDWMTLHAGYTTIVMMTATGHAFSDDVKQLAISKMQQAIGSQFIAIVDPSFVDFNVTATLRLTGLITQSITLASVESRLRDFYAGTASNFGRTILRSEIIAVIEGTQGVDRIVPQEGGEILASPDEDVEIAPYQLPRLVTVTLTVV